MTANISKTACSIFIIVLLISFVKIASARTDIVPLPVSANILPGDFTIDKSTVIVLPDANEQNTATFFNNYLQKHYGFSLAIYKEAKENYIEFSTKKFIQKPMNEGHYTLQVSGNKAIASGDSYRGTFYAMQTLLQLLPLKQPGRLQMPNIAVDDYPRYNYRGMHLDVCRHFFSVDFIKKYIDYLALHKLNTFHWHLTDDQGWRVEIKKYPKLTTAGGFRNGTIIGRYPGTGNDGIYYGGFYTQQQIKDVIDYAANRYITVLPEIEMPGHASAAIAAYPYLSCFPDESTKPAPGTAWSGPTEGKQVQQAWGVFEDVFCAGKDETFTFLEDVLDEVLTLFPSEYIHIGGDECPKDNWKRCPQCQQRMKELNLKDEHELQSYFIQRIEKYINSKGRKIIGWDEILEGGLAPNASVMSWRGEVGGIEAANQNHDVIMTPGKYVYFDHAQSTNEDSVTIGGYTPIQVTYGYEPTPAELDSTKWNYILGAQANVWTEYIKNESKVEYMIFPRMAALAEILWSPKSARNWNNFAPRLLTQFKRYDLWNANYSKAYFDIESTLLPTPNHQGMLWKLESKSTDPIFITNLDNNAGMKYNAPVLLNGSGNYQLSIVDAGKTISTLNKHFLFNKATGKSITLKDAPVETYAGNGGAFGLVNGLVSTVGFNSNEWMGWKGKNMEAVIDLNQPEQINNVTLDVWKQEPSAVYLPSQVEVYLSDDTTHWTVAASVKQPGTGWPNNRKITIDVPGKTSARFVKIIASNYGTIGEGKRGAGQSALLFVDEIEIN